MQDNTPDACCYGLEHFTIMIHIPVYLFQEKSDILLMSSAEVFGKETLDISLSYPAAL